MNSPLVIIGGSGGGLGGGLVKVFKDHGFKVGEISRSGSKQDTSSFAVRADLTRSEQAKRAIDQIVCELGSPSVYIHNAAYLHFGSFLATEPDDFEQTWRVSTLGAVNGVRAVLPYMLSNQQGTILVSGATAAIRGGANFSAFSSAKFALRGLTQSLAREFQPQGIHIAHVILDGLMKGTPSVSRFGGDENTSIDPVSAAKSYLALVNQPKSAWAHEIDLRPYTEKF